MPCVKKYTPRQRRAYYATKGWRREPNRRKARM